jgi:hypothetical protein
VTFRGNGPGDGFAVELEDMGEEAQGEVEDEGEEDAEEDGAGEEVPECLSLSVLVVCVVDVSHLKLGDES